MIFLKDFVIYCQRTATFCRVLLQASSSLGTPSPSSSWSCQKDSNCVFDLFVCVCGVCSLQVILRATQLKHVKASHFLQWRVPAVDHIRAICTLHFPADPKCSAKPKGQKKLFHLWSRDLPGDKLYLNIFKPPSRRHVFGGPVRPWSYNQVKAPKRRGL